MHFSLNILEKRSKRTLDNTNQYRGKMTMYLKITIISLFLIQSAQANILSQGSKNLFDIISRGKNSTKTLFVQAVSCL